MNREYTTYSEVISDLLTGALYTPLSKNYRKIWIPNCFHYTQLENAVSAIQNGKLLSREKALETRTMWNDNASAQVISGTDEKWKSFVRLYFRPKTPTQFHNEGIRSEETKSYLQAHCPIPIFFIFDLEKVLMRPDSWFSATSLAKHSQNYIYNDVENFSLMPFAKIYHDGAFSQSEREDIIAHRHAEVLVEEQLPFSDTLKSIVSRSKAEAETLFYLLNKNSKNNYGSLIKVDTKKYLYYGKWFYINEVTLGSQEVGILFNVGEYITQFAFRAYIKFQGQCYEYIIDSLMTTPELVLSIPEPLSYYEIEIYLDSHLAYKNNYTKQEECSDPY